MRKTRAGIIAFGLQALLAAATLSNAYAKGTGEEETEERQAKLDRLCEIAREEKLKPARKKLIEECIREWGKEKSECEQFYQDYGDAVRLANGVIRPKLFLDLPECVKAFEFQRSYRKP